MIKRKFSYYFSVGTNAFAWQTVILSIINILFGTGVSFNSYVVLQCLCVGFTIAFLMFFTDKLTLKTNFPTKILVDLIDVFLVVLIMGGALFKWFEFVLADLAIVAGVILAVYFVVFAITIVRDRIDSDFINKKIKERNKNENSH
ncbi:MAG: DUF3021 family protein [Ruminococcus sp.]